MTRFWKCSHASCYSYSSQNSLYHDQTSYPVTSAVNIYDTTVKWFIGQRSRQSKAIKKSREVRGLTMDHYVEKDEDTGMLVLNFRKFCAV